jgi:putative nucleotidyltransferase with HDIG domain
MQDWNALLAMDQRRLAGVIELVLLGALFEILAVRASVGAHQSASSISFLPFFATVLLFPPPAAVFAVAATSFPTQILVHKKPLLRAAFNSAQAVIAIAVAVEVYAALGGVSAVPLSDDILTVRGVLSFTGLAVTFFAINQVLVSIGIAFLTGNRVTTIVSRVAAPSGANLAYDVLVSPIAIVVALLYSSYDVGGLIMVCLPLMIIRYSYMNILRLQQANKDLLTVLVKTIETRDPYTSGHSIRVSLLARAIAEDMDLPASRIDQVEMAAIVHDIGKVDAIYASIIRKEGSLTDAERRVIVTHAAKGAEFLETLTSFSKDVIEGVRHHHERYDGTGYPNGLVGSQIPLPARIIMLCDSIDAMLSDRPYRKALSPEQVRHELVRCAGTQFDPRIVEIILRRNTLHRAAALVRPETDVPLFFKATA